MNPTNYVYFLNPCAPLTSVASTPQLQTLLNACKTNNTDANSCQMETTLSAGFPKYMGVSSQLDVQDNFYQLWMDGGSRNDPGCRSNVPRQTVIRFYCGSSIVCRF